jgi:2-oxo-3-hexenedioate decarboxylase
LNRAERIQIVRHAEILSTLTLVTLFAMCGCVANSTTRDVENPYLLEFWQSEAAGRTFPPVTELMPQMSLHEAYAVQQQIVSARLAKGDKIAGYKGGLMSAASLAARHVTEPLTGVLFVSGDGRDGAQISLCGYRRAGFELKLGYVFARQVRTRIESLDQLRTLVAAVQPVVELPDIAYRDDKTYNAVDMVAANITAAYFVRGIARPAGAIDLDALNVTLKRDGVEIARGHGRESLGAQWESLRTVANLVIANGGRIEPGQIVVTGRIDNKGDLLPGTYSADYESLGVTTFTVVHCSRAIGAR